MMVVLNANGNATGDEYYWLNDAVGMEPGWYDGSWAPITGVTVKAGDALWINSPNSADVKLVLPAIETK